MGSEGSLAMGTESVGCGAAEWRNTDRVRPRSWSFVGLTPTCGLFQTSHCCDGFWRWRTGEFRL